MPLLPLRYHKAIPSEVPLLPLRYSKGMPSKCRYCRCTTVRGCHLKCRYCRWAAIRSCLGISSEGVVKQDHCFNYIVDIPVYSPPTSPSNRIVDLSVTSPPASPVFVMGLHERWTKNNNNSFLLSQFSACHLIILIFVSSSIKILFFCL